MSAELPRGGKVRISRQSVGVSESEAGFYARKQLSSRDRIIAWSHRRRFETTLALAFEGELGSLLDVGCGDGTFAGLAKERFAHVTGCDLDAAALADCRARYARKKIDFRLQSELQDVSFDNRFDVVTCMEVLEHCSEGPRREILKTLNRVVRPEGRVIVSVPIEVGASLLVKEGLRTLAGLRRIGDYRHKERYTLRELKRMVLADGDTAIDRQRIQLGSVEAFAGHKGFNWIAFQKEVADELQLTDVHFSPVPTLGRWLNSQVYFVCRPRR